MLLIAIIMPTTASLGCILLSARLCPLSKHHLSEIEHQDPFCIIDPEVWLCYKIKQREY